MGTRQGNRPEYPRHWNCDDPHFCEGPFYMHLTNLTQNGTSPLNCVIVDIQYFLTTTVALTPHLPPPPLLPIMIFLLL